MLGTGTMTSESVTAALAIAFYAQDPHLAADICANLGGDTDTIGAMACAICGAYKGLSAFDPKVIAFLEETNKLNFNKIAREIIEKRSSFIKE